MANAIYPNGKEHFANAEIDWVDDTITIYLVDLADYTYSATHNTLVDLPAASRVASVNLASKTNADGLLDAADATFTAVTGDVSEALVIAKNTGTESTSWLILFLDTSVTGLPVTPNGGNITVTFNASGIIQL